MERQKYIKIILELLKNMFNITFDKEIYIPPSLSATLTLQRQLNLETGVEI